MSKKCVYFSIDQSECKIWYTTSLMNCSTLGNATDVIHFDLLLFRSIYYSVSTIGNSTRNHSIASSKVRLVRHWRNITQSRWIVQNLNIGNILSKYTVRHLKSEKIHDRKAQAVLRQNGHVICHMNGNFVSFQNMYEFKRSDP